ncbi:MAG: hypothetical protein KJO80_07405 [Gammaproteobacteria bacterium]|nr:hypothetical protein [Gammaproteobacteria bacterium]
MGASDALQDSPKFFIHIPKTAGTSLRTSAESRFGTSRVLRDYGLHSDATSDLVRKLVYATGDSTGINRAIQLVDAAMIVGHVPLHKYGSVLGLANTVTIFRNPVEQVISHYRHAVRDHGFHGDLIAFAQQNGVRNLQSRMLGNNDPALIGIVGLTEFYRSTLTMLNYRWNWKLRHRKRNVSKKLGSRTTDVSEKEKKEIEKLNSTDLAVYNRASLIFRNSLKFSEMGMTRDYRGAITLCNTKHGIKGWAFDMYSDDMARVEILINETPFRSVDCGDFLSPIACWKLSRNGHVGFSAENHLLDIGDRVAIRAIDDGTLLAETTAVRED